MTRPNYEGEPPGPDYTYVQGHWRQNPEAQYPPTYMNTYHNMQPDPNTEKARRDFFNVAKWGMWTWIAVTVLPILLILACCGFCVIGGAVGSVLPSTTPTP